MSYIEKARQNQENAQKAAAFDKLKQQQRDKDVYSVGTNDAYAEVERIMLRKAEEKALRKLQASAPSQSDEQVSAPVRNTTVLPNGLANTLTQTT